MYTTVSLSTLLTSEQEGEKKRRKVVRSTGMLRADRKSRKLEQKEQIFERVKKAIVCRPDL